MYSIGLAVRSWFHARQQAQKTGARLARNTTALVHLCFNMMRSTSVVFLEIHLVVEARHLIAVAVEHQRRAFAELAQSPLARLAPSRMVHFRVYIRVEAILRRIRQVPRSRGLAAHKLNLHN